MKIYVYIYYNGMIGIMYRLGYVFFFVREIDVIIGN